MINIPQILGFALDEISELVEKAGASSLEVLEQKFRSWLE